MPLELRPQAAEERKRWGDFEADLMLGLRLGRSVIAVVVERRSRYVRLFLLPNRRAESVNEALRRAVSECPVPARTLTADNGKEFARHRGLRARTGLQVYFTDPYSAYQKGTVEYFIGVLRRKLPKCTDFAKLTERGLQQVEHRLNSRCWNRPHYKTPKEVYISCSSVRFIFESAHDEIIKVWYESASVGNHSSCFGSASETLQLIKLTSFTLHSAGDRGSLTIGVPLTVYILGYLDNRRPLF